MKLTWNDNTITDTAYVVQRMEGTGPWANIKVIPTPLSVTNTTGPMSYNDPNWQSTVAYQYRVIAQNTVGYGGAFPTMTAQSISNAVAGPIPAPSGLTATPQAGNKMKLAWTDNSANETGFRIQRAVGAGAFAQIGQVGANVKAFTDPAVSIGVTYSYRVAAFNTSAQSGWSNTATATYPSLPAAPTITSAIAARTSATTERITVNWTSVPGATGYIVQWSSTNTFATIAGSVTVGNVTSVRPANLAIQTWYVRMYATNLAGSRRRPQSRLWLRHRNPREPAERRRGLRAPPRVSVQRREQRRRGDNPRLRVHGVLHLRQNVAFLAHVFLRKCLPSVRGCCPREGCGDDVPMSAPTKALRQVAPIPDTAVILDRYPMRTIGTERALSSAGVRLVGSATSPRDALALLTERTPEILVLDATATEGAIDSVALVRLALQRSVALRVIALVEGPAPNA